MKLITKQEKIDSVVERWRDTYFLKNGNEWSSYGLNKEEVYNKLKDLRYPTEKEIVDIIGNNTWTAIRCDECDFPVESAIIFSNGEDVVNICVECLRKAVKLSTRTEE